LTIPLVAVEREGATDKLDVVLIIPIVAVEREGTTDKLDVVLTIPIVVVEREGTTDKLDVVSFSSGFILVWGFIPLPILGMTSTGTVTPTISAIMSAMATPSTILNMTVLLEQQRHLPGGRTFWNVKSSSSTSSSNEARRGMPSL
jgi:hypothetical protein